MLCFKHAYTLQKNTFFVLIGEPVTKQMNNW